LVACSLPLAALAASPFGAQGHMAHDPEKKGTKGPTARLHALEDAALLETLQKDILNGIVEFIPAGRVTPARRQIGADDRDIAARKLGAIAVAAGGRSLNDGPAGRFGSDHESVTSNEPAQAEARAAKEKT